MSPRITVIAHNIRSTHNVGSIFRTCEGFGVERLILSGYTPYPQLAEADSRLPHETAKITSQIHKTALGAETILPYDYVPDIAAWIGNFNGKIVALEQAPSSIALSDFHADGNVALLLGEEVNGISPQLLELCDTIIEIPMKGQKESFNVSVACGIALYGLSI